jgi:hypothetical protein
MEILITPSGTRGKTLCNLPLKEAARRLVRRSAVPAGE